MHVYECVPTFARSNFQRLKIGYQYPAKAVRLSMRDHVFRGFEFLVEAALKFFRDLVPHATFISFRGHCFNGALISLSFEQLRDRDLVERLGLVLLGRRHSSQIDDFEIA